MPSEKEKRRKSIAYILRRRKRGRKVGANSGEVVKSWAEYSEVNFKPTGAYMGHGRWLAVLLSCLAAFIPVIIFIAARFFAVDHPEDLRHVGLHPIGWALVGIASLLTIVFCFFALASIGLSIWRVVISLRRHKKE